MEISSGREIQTSYSRVDTYQKCPKLYHNQYIKRLVKQDLDARDIDLEWGHALHEALAEIYRGKSIDVAIDKFSQAFTPIETEIDHAKTLEAGIYCLNKYYEWYKDKDKDFEILEIEALDYLILSHPTLPSIKWKVKLDLVYRHKGNIYFLDHKTTGKINDMTFKRFDPNLQFDAYYTYIHRKYGECVGGIVNAIMINDADKNKLLDVDDPERHRYEHQEVKHCTYHKKEMVYCSGLNCKFDRSLITRNYEQMKSFETEAVEWTHRIESDKLWLRSKSACHGFRGCPYIELCQTLDDENIEQSLYNVREDEEHDSQDGRI